MIKKIIFIFIFIFFVKPIQAKEDIMILKNVGLNTILRSSIHFNLNIFKKRMQYENKNHYIR